MKFIETTKENRQKMMNIAKNNYTLKKYREGLINSVSADDKKKFNEKIKVLIEENTQYQNEVNTSLQTTYNEFIEGLSNDANIIEQEKRICRNLHSSGVKHFQELMSEFQALESDLKSTNEAMILRSAEIALSRKLTPEEQMNIIQKPEIVQDMIQAKLGGQAHSKLVDAVRDLEDRHAEIKKLEQSIIQVHNLINELAALVRLQGEMIDNICDNIASAKSDTLQAEQDIFKSKENMKAARKKKCLILVIVVVIALVIAGPIVFKFI